MQWFKYPESSSTWENEVNVNAAHLVRRFWDDLGITREEFDGELIQASDDFIGA